MPSQHFTDLLKKMDEVHRKKNHDYAQDSDPFSNFTRASELISWFKNPIDQVFAGIIGIKLARLAELLNGKEPKNESLDDNMLDLANYCGLWAAMKLRDREVEDAFWDKKTADLSHLKSDTKNLLNGIERPIAIDENGGFLLPEICSECRQHGLIENMITHAIQMHSAIWDGAQRTLKYPSKGLYLFPPNYNVGKYSNCSSY